MQRVKFIFKERFKKVFALNGIPSHLRRKKRVVWVDSAILDEKLNHLECKLDKSAKEVLEQIESKGYAAPFVKDKRKLYKIGVNFSCFGTRDIDDYGII